MIVLLEKVEPDYIVPSSLAIGHGIDDETGERVVFAGEARYLYQIDLPELVELEPWQVLSRKPA